MGKAGEPGAGPPPSNNEVAVQLSCSSFAPMSPPTYNPVQLHAGAVGAYSGALTAKSAAKVRVPISAAMVAVQIVALFMLGPPGPRTNL